MTAIVITMYRVDGIWEKTPGRQEPYLREVIAIDFDPESLFSTGSAWPCWMWYAHLAKWQRFEDPWAGRYES